MVFVQAARKTGAFVLLAGVLSLSILAFLSDDLGPTARVVSDSVGDGPSGMGWLVFSLGVFVGTLLVGTYVYIAHIEAKREE